MARIFHTPIDLNKNELRNARVQNVSTAPATPVTGQLYYDTDDNILYWWNGTTWVSASGGASGIPGTIGDVKGDLITFSAADTPVRIAAGADDTILMADSAQGSGLKWAASATPSTQAFGDAAAVGTGDTFTRGDHKHAMPADPVTAHVAAGDPHTGYQTEAAHNTALHQEMIATADLTDWPRVAALDLNSQKITSLGTPTADTDAATKLYVDGLSSGLSWKDSVRAATTAAITISTGLNSGDVIDGVTLANGDRVLVKDQAAGQENGIYVVAASPARSTDADTASEILQSTVWVEEGTANADTAWVNSTNAPITLGTTPLVFVQYSALGQITAGAGLTKTGATLDVGAGTGIVANANDVAVLRTDANGRVALRYSTLYGDNAATSFTITHNLNSLDVVVECYLVADGVKIEPDIVHATVNTVTIIHATAPASNAFKCVVIG